MAFLMARDGWLAARGAGQRREVRRVVVKLSGRAVR